MSRGARAIIHLSALEHNYRLAQRAAPNSKIVPIIKANAYGHGSVQVAQCLSQASMFGVACLEEAIELRASGIRQDILLLEGFFHERELQEIEQADFLVMLHSMEQVKILSRRRLKTNLRAWIKVNTGMNRLGIAEEELGDAITLLQKNQFIKIETIASHLACADDKHNQYTNMQISVFENVTKPFSIPRSLANSAAILGWPNTHFEWVRPGIMLYGASPFLNGDAAQDGLLGVMELSAKIIAVHHAQQGEAIGYGSTWVCPETMPIGVVGIGYGDGYPRVVPNGTPVHLQNKEVPIIGRVSMDMLCIDLRQTPHVKIGDEVQLWGDKIAIDRIARAANTIAYELTCGITRRVSYEYREARHGT